jgi:hypothetical protein
VALTVALMIGLRRTAAPGRVRRCVLTLFAVELAQGAIGYTHPFRDRPHPLTIV